MNRKNIRLVLSSLLAGLITCFIFSQSLLNGEQSAQESGFFMTLFRSIFDPQYAIDEALLHTIVRKGAHFLEFALLGSSLHLLMWSIRDRFGIFCPGFMLFAALAIAVTDEFIQSFTGRFSSAADVLLDFSGAAFAMAFLWLIHVLRNKKEKRYAAKKCATE